MKPPDRRQFLAASWVATLGVAGPAIATPPGARLAVPPADRMGVRDIAFRVIGSTPSAGLQRLMQVPANQRDLEWLRAALLVALRLEFSTIPPYLCALWSIKDPFHPARASIRRVVLQEMRHMALVCNMLASVGVTPPITRPGMVPTYPTTLPGGVRPGLRVALQGLTRDFVRSVMMEIERPGIPVHTIADNRTYATIGSFYAAVSEAFAEVPRGAITGGRQLTLPLFDVAPIATARDARHVIDQIRHEGEGGDKTPETGAGRHGLAHYYAFAEIYYERRLVADNHGHWTYAGEALPSPRPGRWPRCRRKATRSPVTSMPPIRAS